MHLFWQDLDPKKPAAQKIAEGCARYAERWGVRPRVALVNEADNADGPAGVRVEVVSYVRRNNFWIGMEVPG